MAWFKPRSVPTEGLKIKVQALKKEKKTVPKSQTCPFVSLVSGPVSLLLQSLVGGFTGHFTASRQPVAAGQSQRPQRSLNVSSSRPPTCRAQTVSEKPWAAPTAHTPSLAVVHLVSYETLSVLILYVEAYLVTVISPQSFFFFVRLIVLSCTCSRCCDFMSV